MIGVLAIMAIVASFTVPNIIRQMQTAKAAGEDAKLDEIAQALTNAIKATGLIPNPDVASTAGSGWVTLTQPYTTLPVDTLRYVFANNSFTERRYYLEPTFAAYLAGLPTPFQTPPDGFPLAGFPSGAFRILLVSCSRGISDPPAVGDLVLPGSLGVNLPAADQTALANWNKIYVAGVVNPPTLISTPFATDWNNQGQFLHIRSIDLRPLFCRVTLVEYPTPQNALTDPAVDPGPPAEHPGVGFSAGTSYLGNTAAGFTFSFVAPVAANPSGSFTTTTPAGVDEGTGGALAGRSKSMIQRTAGVANDNGTIPAPGGGTSATFSATVSPAAPYPPWWGISPPINTVDQQMPTDANTQSFYVIKGTTLSLYADGLAIPATPTLTLQINSDCTFEYFNGSWTRVD
jgi:type II secretory pathway pseudopilin PulG